MSIFEEGEFDIILDKGTLDSVLCGENAKPLVEKMLEEVYKVMKKGGAFICISYGNENSRLSYLKLKDWKIEVKKIAKPSKMFTSDIEANYQNSKNFHHIFIMTK